ncbi:MAG: FHA domain-containing protein [Planctomycetales bacterium]|nr:FHA domain-containing protein [Planctomycetales bacterium]
MSLGRTAGNDIAVEDEGVSGVHAYIRLTPDGAAVFDAGSSNGTMVNTALALPGMPTRLRDGDVLSLGGRVRLLYCVPESLWTLARSFGS